MGGCTLNILYDNTLQLNHTFTSAGVHCLDISVRNDISQLQSSFSVTVKKSSELDCAKGHKVGEEMVKHSGGPMKVSQTFISHSPKKKEETTREIYSNPGDVT